MQILALNIAAYSEIQFNALACAFQTFKKAADVAWTKYSSSLCVSTICIVLSALKL